MTTLLQSAFIMLVLYSGSVLSEEPYTYEPSKFVELRAESYCQSLASMSLGKQAILSLAGHTKPESVGTSHEGKKVIAVYFPYRTDGIMFACIFNDFTDGQLQLIEFGHVGNGVDDVTKIKKLY